MGTKSPQIDKKDTTRLDDNDIMTRSNEWITMLEHYDRGIALTLRAH